jgi:hypothetical protein
VNGPPTVFASHRDAGAGAFGDPEQVSLAGDNVLSCRSPHSTGSRAGPSTAYSLLTSGVWVSVRP